MKQGLFTENRSSILAVIAIAVMLILFSLVLSLSESGELGSFGFTMLSGLFQAMLLFLVASGLSIIFGLMDVLNLAQGTFFLVGAYAAYAFHHSPQIMEAISDPNLRFFLSLIAGTAVGAILGALLEIGLLRPLYARPIFQIVLTFGISIVMLEAVRFIWGTIPYAWVELFSFRESTFELLGRSFSTYRLFVIIIGFLLIGGIALLLQRTRIGIVIRAGVEDSEMVEALGINVRMVFTLVFVLGCAIAAFGGAVIAPFRGATNSLGSEFLLLAIAAVILGGMGSYEGTAIGSLLIGLSVAVVVQFVGSEALDTLVDGLANLFGESIRDGLTPILATLPSITPMLLMIAVLLLRPSGLFGKEE